MIITTGDSTSPHVIAQAQSLAKELGCLYTTRRKQSFPQLRKRYGDDQFLIMMDSGIRYTQIGQADLTYHPSMAFIRSKRLLNGESDTMIRAARTKPGDVVLDCTAGLGGDALVFSMAVGDTGSVTACESQLPLYVLVREGLRAYVSEVEEINRAMRRIRMEHSPYLDMLLRLPDRSVDTIYFDPMFRLPVHESAAIDPLRHLANHEPLAAEAVQEAIRVARKTVVMKELRGSEEFTRLGFSRVERTGSKLAYGVIDIVGNE
ncbi:class I SAM-dependent methyltransferase [Paenibacillus taiwanensis]|uniref:class I SAM-dependent methyltransferase n=1 Tax=Paenibacillus taiwanensis TaxID=401638 RepID=UPI0003FBB4F9|nr:class I SAM-dependent methyltransferase [Paenibacillus taiwanensis]